MSLHIVSFSDATLTLSSSLALSAFGRTNFSTLLDEQGVVAHLHDQSVSFRPWHFSETAARQNDIAEFIGAFPPDLSADTRAHTLLSISETGTPEDQATAACAVCTAITEALNQHITLESVGAEGIIICADASGITDVLFLPPSLFERCAANVKTDYNRFQGWYLRKGLSGEESLLFTRAVIAYRALTGTLPYPEPDLSKRQADIYDARFLPLTLAVNGIPQHITAAIDCGLRVSAEEKPLPGERRFVSEKDRATREAIIQQAKTFSSAAFKDALFSPRVPACSDEAFLAQQKAFLKKQQRTIRRNRFTRRNKHRLAVGALVLVVAVWAVVSFNRENQILATSKGLTSAQTVQVLYETVHRSNVPSLREIAKGRKMKNLIQIVSGFYVTNRSRFAMNQEEDTVSPAEWLYLKNKTAFWQYGVTNLAIDGVPTSVTDTIPTRADKPAPLTDEPGIPLKQGATVTHTATYYLVHNDNSARINIEKTTDTVTLTWKRNRWIATDIASSSKSTAVFTKDFKADYQSALDTTEENVSAAAELLRNTYPWLPSAEEIAGGEASLRKKYRLPEKDASHRALSTSAEVSP